MRVETRDQNQDGKDEIGSWQEVVNLLLLGNYLICFSGKIQQQYF